MKDRKNKMITEVGDDYCATCYKTFKSFKNAHESTQFVGDGNGGLVEVTIDTAIKLLKQDGYLYLYAYGDDNDWYAKVTFSHIM